MGRRKMTKRNSLIKSKKRSKKLSKKLSKKERSILRNKGSNIFSKQLNLDISNLYVVYGQSDVKLQTKLVNVLREHLRTTDNSIILLLGQTHEKEHLLKRLLNSKQVPKKPIKRDSYSCKNNPYDIDIYMKDKNIVLFLSKEHSTNTYENILELVILLGYLESIDGDIDFRNITHVCGSSIQLYRTAQNFLPSLTPIEESLYKEMVKKARERFLKYFEKIDDELHNPPPPDNLLKTLNPIKSSKEYKIIDEYLNKLKSGWDYTTKQIKSRKVNYDKYLSKVYDTGVLKSGGSSNDMEPGIQELIEKYLGGDCLGVFNKMCDYFEYISDEGKAKIIDFRNYSDDNEYLYCLYYSLFILKSAVEIHLANNIGAGLNGYDYVSSAGIVGTFLNDDVLFLNGSVRGKGQGASDSSTQAILNLIDNYRN
tara:strand:- start:2387 stop:3658 length:1272 start_codon:yes stop_codon:yes gene_type:complete